MAPTTAARLARRLLQVHSQSVNFFIELDTAENASLLADELRALGCGVLYDSNDFRLNIYTPLHQVVRHDDQARPLKSSAHSLLSKRIHNG